MIISRILLFYLFGGLEITHFSVPNRRVVHLLGPHIGIEQSEGLFSCTSRCVPFFEQNHWVWGINMV